MWPGLGWTGDLSKDKHIAESPYYRHFTYRFMCKKLGHGSNYGGQPPTLAEEAHVDLNLVRQFQPKYFAAFPAHQQWQAHVAQTLRSTGCITSLLGRRRYFLGRRGDSDTLRGAIAYDPQSSLADIVNRALLNIWRDNISTIVMHDHDALTFMYREDDEDTVVPRLMEALILPVQLAHGRVLRIPYDCKVGWNKGEYDQTKNPNGLRDYAGHDDRRRIPEARPKPRSSILDKLVVKSKG
jgi:hypothetical protein